jgi:hypothetical protein
MRNQTLVRRVALLLPLLASFNVACSADLKDFEARQYKDADGNVLLYRLYKPKD